MFKTQTEAQCSGSVTITDTNFKSALVAHGKSINGIGVSIIDTNNDGEIQCSEANAYTGSIVVISKNVVDFTGLEQFVNITKLFVGFNSLTNLDVSANTKLTQIDVSSNNLTSLDVSKNILLETLTVSENNLSSLDVTANTALKILNFRLNSISSIDLSQNSALEELYFSNNNTTSLDVSSNVNLKRIEGNVNNIASLDITNNTLLERLALQANSLTSLDFSQNQNLTNINLRDNKFVNLDVSNNPNLVQFISDDNPDLETLNVANGNNVALINMWTNKAPKLTCIQHDTGFDPTARTNGRLWIKDNTASWSTNCNATAALNDINKVDFEFFPNPTSNFVNIAINDEIEKGEVLNLLGKKLISFNKEKVDVSNLSSGMYLIKIETISGKIGIRKIIKK